MENNIYLDVLSFENLETIRKGRNEIVKNGIFRTSYLLTYHMQKKFFDDVVNNRNSNSRYFGIFKEEAEGEKNINLDTFIGYCGLDKIEWENGIAEVGLLISSKYIGLGYGSKALKLILNEAFNNMRLQNIYGECYKCNPNLAFWEKMIKKYNGYNTILPARKFFDGSFFDSLYFNFNYYDFGEID
jgi:RimJ/RimL family protein N-acetyltransferase